MVIVAVVIFFVVAVLVIGVVASYGKKLRDEKRYCERHRVTLLSWENFCPHCGSPGKKLYVCECGRTIRVGEEFCTDCGKKKERTYQEE